MNLHRLGRAAAFVAGSIVGGLALAFVIVFLRPQLLQRPTAGARDTAPEARAAQDNNIRSAAPAPAAPAALPLRSPAIAPARRQRWSPSPTPRP